MNTAVLRTKLVIYPLRTWCRWHGNPSTIQRELVRMSSYITLHCTLGNSMLSIDSPNIRQTFQFVSSSNLIGTIYMSNTKHFKLTYLRNHCETIYGVSWHINVKDVPASSYFYARLGMTLSHHNCWVQTNVLPPCPSWKMTRHKSDLRMVKRFGEKLKVSPFSDPLHYCKEDDWSCLNIL